MQAVILAAGMGTRLKDLTQTVPKCMIEVHGVSVAERMLKQLDTLALTRIVFVVGFEGELLANYVRSLGTATPIEIVDNPIYASTNNIYSLWLARDYLAAEDTLLIESDLILDESILANLVADPRPSLALVDAYESWMDGTVVTLSNDDCITSFIGGKEMSFVDTSAFFKTVNIYKLSREFSSEVYLPALEAHRAEFGDGVYYETALGKIALEGTSELRARRLNGERWYEVDDLQDLDIAETLFAPDAEYALELMRARKGGYWRYPRLADAQASVLPGFPSKRMCEELSAMVPTLLTNKSSGADVGSVLAGKLFGIHPELCCMANNADSVRLHAQNMSLTVIDQSWCEFTNETSLLTNEALLADPSLVVLHDIGASYGLPGIKAIAVGSSNKEFLARLRSDVLLCSLSSVDEYVLQIVEKYKKERIAATKRFVELQKTLLDEFVASGLTAVVVGNKLRVEIDNVAVYEKRAEQALVDRNILLPKPYVEDGRTYVNVGASEALDASVLVELLK